MSDPMKFEFHRKTFVFSVVTIIVYTTLVTAAYLDAFMCPYNAQPEDRQFMVSKRGPPTSIFSPDFKVFPCHLIDVVMYIYIVCLVVFMTKKWWTYKNLGWHYFLLDYCYFHNAALTVYLIWAVISYSWHTGPPMFGVSPNSDGFVVYNLKLDIAPIAVGVSRIPQEQLFTFGFLFIAILGGSCGALLWGGVAMWRNALLFHDEDKMTSCYLHLAPGITQTLLLHAAMRSIGGTLDSTHLSQIRSACAFDNVLLAHIAMFLVWQLFYHLVNETRKKQRIRKAQKLGLIHEGDYKGKVERVTAYTYLMASPPGGKSGFLYKWLTLFGEGEAITKIMFTKIQLCLHIVFLALGYAPIYFSVLWLDAAPLLLYMAGWCLLSLWNASILLKGWIKKLKQKVATPQPSPSTANLTPDWEPSQKAKLDLDGTKKSPKATTGK